MANPVCDIQLTAAPLAFPKAAPGEQTGAVVDFWGVVRGTEEAEQISGILYEAHPAMADHQLRTLAAEAAKAFDVQHILLHHRTGFVAVGEPSLLLRVGSRHRAAAFSASVWIVDELKKRVPIWKRPMPRQAAHFESDDSAAATGVAPTLPV